MDFKDKVGKYSKPNLQKNQKATKIKQKKLKFAPCFGNSLNCTGSIGSVNFSRFG